MFHLTRRAGNQNDIRRGSRLVGGSGVRPVERFGEGSAEGPDGEVCGLELARLGGVARVDRLAFVARHGPGSWVL